MAACGGEQVAGGGGPLPRQRLLERQLTREGGVQRADLDPEAIPQRVALNQRQGSFALFHRDREVGIGDAQVGPHVRFGCRGHGQDLALALHLGQLGRVQHRFLRRHAVGRAVGIRAEDFTLELLGGFRVGGVALMRPDGQSGGGVAVAALLVGFVAALLELKVSHLGQVVVGTPGNEAKLCLHRHVERDFVLLARLWIVALPKIGRTQIESRAGDKLRLQGHRVGQGQHALRVLDRTREVFGLAINQAQVGVCLEHRSPVGQALVQVERVVLVLQRTREIAGAPPVFAQGLLQHGQRRLRERMPRTQRLGTVECGPRARVVTQHVRPAQPHQRDDEFLDQARVGGRTVADPGTPQVVGAVLVESEGTISVAWLVKFAECAVDTTQHQRVLGGRGNAQRLLVRALFALGQATHAPQRRMRQQQFEALVRQQRFSRQRVDEAVGLGPIGQFNRAAQQQRDEGVGITGLARMPQRALGIPRSQRLRHLPGMPGAAGSGIVQLQPLVDALLHQRAQRQPLRDIESPGAQECRHRTLGLFQVAVIGAGAHRPQAAQVAGRRFIGLRVVAVAKRLHRLEAVVAHHRQHGPPTGARQPVFATYGCLRSVRPQLCDAPAQQPLDGAGLCAFAAQGIASGTEHGWKHAARQPPRDMAVLAQPFREGSVSVCIQQGLQQRLGDPGRGDSNAGVVSAK